MSGVESTAGKQGPVWSAIAEAYDRSWTGLAEPARVEIAAVCGIGRGTRLLDVGCGPGTLLGSCAARGAVVAGLDAAEGMVALARARAPEADV